MNYLLHILVATLVFVNICKAQESEYEYYTPTKEDLAYRNYRMRKSIPPYGLEKVNRLIKSIENKYFEDSDGGISALKAPDFKALALREKFTYIMVNPEMYSQNCAVFIPLPDEDKKIFAHLMSWVDETQWSERQENFMRENRDSVFSLIQESTLRSKRMGVNYKDAIVLVNGWEMIPFVIDYYKSNPKDKDALTLLLLLMKKGEYLDFVKSSSFKKLYGTDYNYENWINYNSANEKLILDRAMGYYNEKLARK